MSGYILCQTKRAKTPYFIENISTNIYTMEELCYYLYHNLYLVDRSIINENLCVWLSEELGLVQLAAKLRPHLGKFAAIEDVLYPIFKEINYLTYEELRELNTRLARLDAELPIVREKKKGDALVENGMLVRGMQLYEGILKKKGLVQEQTALAAAICHNLGCVCSYLFQMEKATDYFWRAYQLDEEKDSLVTYLLAYRIIHTQAECRERLLGLSVEEDVMEAVGTALEEFKKKPAVPVDAGNIDARLEEFMREYHRSTGS